QHRTRLRPTRQCNVGFVWLRCRTASLRNDFHDGFAREAKRHHGWPADSTGHGDVAGRGAATADDDVRLHGLVCQCTQHGLAGLLERPTTELYLADIGNSRLTVRLN